jgi:predicted GNAT family acetyltransferase
MTLDAPADAPGDTPADVTDNPAAQRYELDVDGQTVFALYRRDGATVAIRHVEAPAALRGSGAAGRLMRGIMETARADGLRVTPLCSYAAFWLQRHPEYHDLLA